MKLNDQICKSAKPKDKAYKLTDGGGLYLEVTPTTAETTLKRLEKDVFPIIGKYPIKLITHKMLLDLANTVKERGPIISMT